MQESIEDIKSGREQLLELEEEGRYVFHGSDNPNIDTLEPRQAHTRENGVEIEDGDPAVFASSKADYAILMALINMKNCPKGFRAATTTKQKENGESYLRLQASKESVDQLNESSEGYVYIFDKSSFQLRKKDESEFTCSVPITSTHKIRVTKEDLPPGIENFE